MASSREEGGPEANSTSESPGTPGTPGTPGSNDSDVPEEFLAFRDLICQSYFEIMCRVTHPDYRELSGLPRS
ncbi:UNVERIFIED_CONTAM: hypothetical protein Sangu_2696100 [Sesamum angustifolium]|uniref:Uncharacterized protein n=1 Tax=Sesamum angustifolium TaxID=2727405 RepID=A0AAW2IYP4_9LAMI